MFLRLLAERLYDRYGEDISSLCMLFPSRRASLFFSDHLSGLIDKPIWQPHVSSVDELMERAAGIGRGEHIKLVTELYKVYGEYHAETFDSFYFWGEVLLADFDAIDKYRINAEMLFANITDLKSIESDLSFLTPEQVGVIRTFWNNFGLPGNEFSLEKERFLKIWRTLFPIYTAFRRRLAEQGIGYAGMVYRLAAGRIENGEAEPDTSKRYVIAGFNALTACEKVLFDALKRCGALFFWDYDRYYTDNIRQEAGLFMRENLKRYPQEIPLDSCDNFRTEKRISVVSSPSDSMQCKYVAHFLDSVAEKDKRTAVVLTDESLLAGVLYSVPDSVESINVTMGYPLGRTLEYSFAERLLELQARAKVSARGECFYHGDVAGLLRHPFLASEESAALKESITRQRRIYIPASDPLVPAPLKNVFRRCETWRDTAAYLIENLAAVAAGSSDRRNIGFISLMADNIRRLSGSLDQCGTDISRNTFNVLLRRVLQSLSVPFEGEPLEGVQVMGILETRNIDFDNVLLLSCNDDNFPGNRIASPSFIPYNLRVAYGLPNEEHHEAMYAYYFYRLVQRAKRIDLAYCSRNDEKSTGEPSRYILQLRFESGKEVGERNINLDVSSAGQRRIVVEKKGHVLEQLNSMLDNEGFRLSPTAITAYVQCPLKFYFRSVARIREEDGISEDIDAPMFGTILHAAMELLYRPLKGAGQPQSRIRELIGSDKTGEAVDKAIKKIYICNEQSEDEFEGNALLVKEVIEKYINGAILPYDSEQRGFGIEGLEERIACGFGVAGRRINVGGTADRIDILDGGSLRVIDYKTGSPHREFDGVDSLFSGRPDYSAVLQIMIYAMICHRSRGMDAAPKLYYVRDMQGELTDRRRRGAVISYLAYKDEFERQLNGVLSEIFDPERPFTQCEEHKRCEMCEFAAICLRK